MYIYIYGRGGPHAGAAKCARETRTGFVSLRVEYVRIPVAQPHEYEYRIPPGYPSIWHGYVHIQTECIHKTG